ncbi:hypothetical protein [Halorubellus litoreus]|uniref:Tat (Twin-arginine translocation) pathway signal sequence n=1 Tax=Halorubellus litoreus TaxID=755308 RepID=A0ABD5VI49_9EURY
MDRRAFLAGSSALAVGATAGCLGWTGAPARSTTESLAVEGDEPTLEPGDSATLVVRTTAIRRCQFTAYCHETAGVELRLNDARLDPEPTAGVMDSYPQIWTWKRRRDVTVTVPVDVAPDASPGQCEYGVAAAGGDDEEVEESFTITVTDG